MPLHLDLGDIRVAHAWWDAKCAALLDDPAHRDASGRLTEEFLVESHVRKSPLCVWRIRPITPELYALREVDGSLVRESVTWASHVDHPDSWMVPLRPHEPVTGVQETNGLDILREDCARIQVTN